VNYRPAASVQPALIDPLRPFAGQTLAITGNNGNEFFDQAAIMLDLIVWVFFTHPQAAPKRGKVKPPTWKIPLFHPLIWYSFKR